MWNRRRIRIRIRASFTYCITLLVVGTHSLSLMCISFIGRTPICTRSSSYSWFVQLIHYIRSTWLSLTSSPLSLGLLVCGTYVGKSSSNANRQHFHGLVVSLAAAAVEIDNRRVRRDWHVNTNSNQPRITFKRLAMHDTAWSAISS